MLFSLIKTGQVPIDDGTLVFFATYAWRGWRPFLIPFPVYISPKKVFWEARRRSMCCWEKKKRSFCFDFSAKTERETVVTRCPPEKKRRGYPFLRHPLYVDKETLLFSCQCAPSNSP